MGSYHPPQMIHKHGKLPRTSCLWEMERMARVMTHCVPRARMSKPESEINLGV